jgi:hypothetical protein
MDRGLQEPALRAINHHFTRSFKSRVKVLITAETFAPLFRGVA